MVSPLPGASPKNVIFLMGTLSLWQKPSFWRRFYDRRSTYLTVSGCCHMGDRPSLEQFSGQLTTIRGLLCRGIHKLPLQRRLILLTRSGRKSSPTGTVLLKPPGGGYDFERTPPRKGSRIFSIFSSYLKLDQKSDRPRCFSPPPPKSLITNH